MKGRPISTLSGLEYAARHRQAVFVPDSPIWNKPKPAAFVLNLSGSILFKLFDAGMYVWKADLISGAGRG